MEKYRPNVAALVIDPRGRLLICERLRFEGAWQFPQGGIDDGETSEEALRRELIEEIGLMPDCYQIGKVKAGYRYEFPTQTQTRKLWKYIGQEQTYYECLLSEPNPVLDLGGSDGEFRAFRWIEPKEFELEWLPDFKKDVYRAVMKDFFGVEFE